MARVQGTIVQLQITFDTDPPDVQVAVQIPGGNLVVAKASTGGVVKTAPANYGYAIDTTPGDGRWEYEVASLGGITNVRAQRAFYVIPKIGP